MRPTPAPRRTTPAPPSHSGRQTAEVRREDILEAATHEFAVSGLHGTSTEVIARRAGVSQPYLFRLFGTKKALFLATVGGGFDHLRTEFGAAAEAALATGDCPFEAMGDRYVELLADRDWLLIQMHAYAACADDEVRALVQRRYGDLWIWLQSLPPCHQGRSVQDFMAMGMLLNVAAAIDLPSILGTEDWVKDCLAPAPGATEPVGSVTSV